MPKTQPSEVAITADTESEVAEIIAKYVQCSSTGLIVSPQMPFEAWLKAAPLYEELFRKSTWMWGDYLLHGDKTYGERHAQAIGDYKDGYIDNVVSVCARFDHSRRRPGIGFTLHAAAASLHPSDADSLLIRAERERWSRADVAREVAKIHEINGTKPKRGRGKSKVVHSGVKNPGPTLDGHVTVETQQKPLYWNGYVLSTKDRIVYQGNQALDHAEAEKAAHFNKLAHAENLINWLEEHGFTRKEGEEPCAQNTPKTASGTIVSESTMTASAPSVGASSGATPSDPAPAPILNPNPNPPGEINLPDDPDKIKEHVERLQDFSIKALSPQPATPEPASTASASKPDLKQWEEFFGNHPAILQRRSMEEAWRIMVDDLAQAIAERDDALEQLKRQIEISGDLKGMESVLDEVASRSPEERAEHHITAFNEIIPKVDWAALKALRRKTWLGVLLKPADELIDTLATPK